MRQLSHMASGSGPVSAQYVSEYVDAKQLAANVHKEFTVPVGAKMVRLTGESSFFYNLNTNASVPADTADGSSSVLVLTSVVLAVEHIPTISVVARGTPVITAEYFG